MRKQIILFFYSFESFTLQHQPIVFLWSLSDCKFPQVFRILLSIRADLNNAVVWSVSTFLFISKSWNLFTSHLWIVLNVPITTGITVTSIFHSFFSSLARCRYFSLFRFLLILPYDPLGRESLLFGRFSLFFFFFFLTITRSSCLAEIWWSDFSSKFQRNFASHSPGRILGRICTIWYFDQISYPIPSWSLFPPSRLLSYTLFAIIYCVHLLCDWSFRLIHHIKYICYFAASHQFHL